MQQFQQSKNAPKQAYGRKEGVELSKQQEEYMLPHFLLLVIGKPGSGKSFTVRDMVTSKHFYGGGAKFDQVLLVSPSAQKLGIPAKRENISTVYNLEWIFEQIIKVNQKQIKRFQQYLAPRGLKGGSTLPFLPQTLISPSLGSDMKNKESSKLPSEYIMFNKNQRFFTAEILTIMGKGYKTAVEQYPSLQKPDADSGGAKRKGKYKNKGKQIPSNQYGQYKDVDDIEKQLVSKLDPKEQESTRFNMLLVLDDVVGDIKNHENDPVQAQLIFNRRHLIANGTISIIIVSQKYTMIPARIRSAASWLVLFRLNPVDFENVYKDVILLSAAKWQEMLDQVFQTKKGESGTAVDKSSKRYDNMGVFVEFDLFFKNFKPLIFK